MQRPIEEPVTSQDGDRGTVTTHPAFGQIGAYRVSGHVSLYASDFKHNGYMTIRICRSELRRDLSHDWHHGTDEIIEVALSEAQWATFVSSPNIGTGVPCTIQAINNRMVPGLPEPQSRVDQFRGEVDKKIQSSLEQVQIALRELDELGIPKSKAQRIRDRLEHAYRHLKSNLPYVAESFSEHMEETVEKAKQEVHGYMQQVIQRAGLEAITNGQLPLQIERKEND